MQEKFKSKKIFLYPNGEDSQAAYYVIRELRGLTGFSEILFIDDAVENLSLDEILPSLSSLDEIWIFHQDDVIFRNLIQKANRVSICPVFNGISRLKEVVSHAIKGFSYKIINEKALELQCVNFCCYFFLHFYFSIKKDSKFIEDFRQEIENLNVYYRKKFKIQKNTVGVPVSNNKHMGDIVSCLESNREINVFYFCYSQEILDSLPQPLRDKTVVFREHCTYMGTLMHVFKYYMTTSIPMQSPNWSSKKIYVPHAYIDPIAALIQRKRPLDDFWFKRRVGINGYRVVSSQSNYKIYKDEFEKLGYEGELVCGGYPSLDVSIDKYKKLSLDGKVDNNILIAVNTLDNVKMMEKFLMQIQNSLYLLSGVKIIFRPYPGHIGHDVVNKFREKFLKYDWFVYDDSSQLSAENMRNSCVLIGDYSSLVWTFPLTTLKPAILVFKDKKNLENSYNGVRFFNPLLHFAASNPDEIFNCIKKARHNTKERAQKILEYRQNEVFNLGKSGEFIANFIIEKLKEDNA